MEYLKAAQNDIEALTDLRMAFLQEANCSPCRNPDLLRENIRSYFRMHLPDESFISWLCIHNGVIIGTSGITFYNLPPSYSNPTSHIGYIMNMYTLKEYRRQGIATVLFQKMLEEGKKKNVGKFILNASIEGKGLYERFGFVSSGDEMILSVESQGLGIQTRTVF